MKQSKKIVLIGNTATSLYNFRLDLIKKLVQENYQVYAFISEYKDEDLEKIQLLGAIPIVYKLKRGGLNPFFDLISTYELMRKIKKIQPYLVFSYFTKPIIYGSLAAKLAKVPTIIGMVEGLGTPFTLHPNGQSLKIKLIRHIQILLYRLVFPFLEKIIFLNPDDPKDLIEHYAIKHRHGAIEMLGAIGLNLQDYPYKLWQGERVSFIFIARLIAEKGIFEYIEAANIVKEKYPDTIFKVIGGLDLENPYGLSKEKLDEIIKKNIVEYNGFVSNVPKHISEAAVFVLPSYYREGVPRSTQEAMAIGRPVITTDVPGCRETVVDGVNGFLVPKWNPQALAEKMIYFIENPKQVTIMGNASHKIATEKFDAEKVNQRLLKILGL